MQLKCCQCQRTLGREGTSGGHITLPRSFLGTTPSFASGGTHTTVCHSPYRLVLTALAGWSGGSSLKSVASGSACKQINGNRLGSFLDKAFCDRQAAHGRSVSL